MDFFKCKLYILGNAGAGKSFFRNTIEDFIHFEKKSAMDKFNGHDWLIRTENLQIEVEIKEYRNSEFEFINFESKEVKNIILYITNEYQDKLEFSIQQKNVEQLRFLSNKAQIIIATPLFRPYELNRDFNFSSLKKIFPFVEYFLPIHDFHYREYENSFQIGHLLRQIIVNSHPYSLKHAKELIKVNLKNEDTTLDLGNCGLTSLNEVKELFQNTHIKKLILSNEWGEFQNGGWERKISNNKLEPNVLFGFPQEIGNLKNLEVLIAGGNWKTSRKRTRYFSSNWYITDIKPLVRLKKLSILNLSNNEIETVASLYQLSHLSKLYLNNNSISNFPSIDKFPELNELYLSNNQIRNIKFLSSEDTAIQTVDLHANQITDLTPIRKLISKIDIKDSKWENNTISIGRNPLSIPPAEVVAKGKQSIEAYFSQLEAEKEIQIKPFKNADIKLIMVGNSNVGKSTFVHWLKMGVVDKTIATTHWLNLGIWKVKKGTKNYTVRVFDFGGQEYYHDTHHLFFTNRTAYALLWDQLSNHFDELEIEQTQSDGQKKTVKIETFPLEYWLDSIRYHTQKRKLTQIEKSITKILDERDEQIEESIRGKTDWTKSVTNSVDKVSEVLHEKEEENILILQNKVDSKQSKIFLNEENLNRNYPKIYDFEQVSLYKNDRLELSKNILFDIFDSLEVLNRQFLGTWNHIKQDIEKNTFNKSFSIEDFLSYCNKIIKRLPELKGKSAAQRKKVLFLIDDAKVFASFLADIGLCLYYPENNQLEGKVFLNQNQILGDLNKILLSINKVNGEISQLDIANTLKKQEESDEVKDIISLMLHFKILFRHPTVDKKSYIAPLYLPPNPPKSIKLFQSLFNNPVYRFHYETFIHKSIILDLFHKYGSKALSETSDDSSFYFWKNGIIIKDEVSKDIAMVKFSSWNNDNKCASLNIYSLSCTNDKFIETIVGHIDSINQGIKVTKLVPDENNKDFIPLDIIHQNEKEENPIFFYNEKYYRLTSFKKYLKTPLKMKKLFISYSKQDIRLVNKFIEHLSALQRDGKVSHWYCSELEAGSNWNDEIQKHFDDSDIVCFMISPNFMKTDYIHEHEIKKAYERKKADQNFKIVPIILNFCRWTTVNNNLGEFTALPYTAKPVMDFKNQDMAWYIIEACLRLMIENDLNPAGEDFYNKQKLPSDILKIYNRIVEDKVDNNSI
ncbi:Ras of Complex, Roc, domain of DAPkinase [Flavobacterium anhuiense]|uniref:Ras of Complex, Roc, domain of DAPkinase n=1 Tax=Flavobacterium anhuiense TaxID=459526 RepID=A0ABY0LXB7_9FLAO|nr:COR domain-containing protein [Flavobacterium anhuiense]SCY75933.1 Ras of Complex, Roc, domain of DAPkinase [Flavobacterium anhuiense]